MTTTIPSTDIVVSVEPCLPRPSGSRWPASSPDTGA